jgi:hypothetical protein
MDHLGTEKGKLTLYELRGAKIDEMYQVLG